MKISNEPFRDDQSSWSARAIYQREGAEWAFYPGDESYGPCWFLRSNQTGQHIFATWDSGPFWTFRIGGGNCMAKTRLGAMRACTRIARTPLDDL